jgi:hypothetical protein
VVDDERSSTAAAAVKNKRLAEIMVSWRYDTRVEVSFLRGKDLTLTLVSNFSEYLSEGLTRNAPIRHYVSLEIAPSNHCLDCELPTAKLKLKTFY